MRLSPSVRWRTPPSRFRTFLQQLSQNRPDESIIYVAARRQVKCRSSQWFFLILNAQPPSGSSLRAAPDAQSARFALTSVLTLSLGVGVATAIFSVIDAVILRPLPYDHPEKIYAPVTL